MWTIENREDAVEFIRNHIDVMQDGQYDQLYALIEPEYIGTPIFTQLLWSCDIHPELEGLTHIPEYYARGLDVESIRLAEGVTSIRYKAFDGCVNLREIYLPRSLQQIDSFVFHHMTGASIKAHYAGTMREWRAVKKSAQWLGRFDMSFKLITTEGTIPYGPDTF